MDERAHHLEIRYLQELDQQGAELQKRMVAGDRLLRGEDRRVWVRFLMSLLNRHPHYVKKLHDLHNLMWVQHEKQGIRELKAEFPYMDPILIHAKFHQDWSQMREEARIDSLRRMMDFGWAGRVIQQARWQVIDLSSSASELLLSDKPVFRSGTFREPGDFIAVPLGPRHLFKASLGLSGSLKPMASQASRLVESMNEHTVASASEFVISGGGDRLPHIDDLLGTRSARSIADIMAEPFGL